MNRGRFVRRVMFTVIAFLVLVIGVTTILSLVLARALDFSAPGPGIVLLAFVLLVAGRLLWTGVRRAAVPIGDLIEAAGRVEAGDYGARVPEWGPREIRGLSRAFNAMTARLEADAEQRQRLLADVSHELRNPLAVIQGNLEGIMDGVYPPDAQHLAPILDETRVLGRLIDDLRTLSLAESGELPLHPEPTDIALLLRDVSASFLPQADAGGVTISVTAPDDLPNVEVDPARTREVLANLLSNALRHTPSGGQVELSAERTPPGESLTVRVADTGTGMPADALERIFDRFYRSPDSPGSGLGLPIAQQLVQAQGGSISAESKPGAGSTITFTLPVGSR
jgi:two-component system, OmpR family, sensor histidine kinase BaeS